MDAIDLGPSAKSNMAAIKLFKMYVMSKQWTHILNTLYLESFHQSTFINIINDLILPKGQTLLILGLLLKTRWPPS